MLRILAIVTGIIFVISGVMGFIPEFVKNGKLFDLFAVNTLRNIIHVIIGSIGMVSGLKSTWASRIYFYTFGAIFLVLAAIGFYQSSGEIFHYLVANYTDNWLHAILAVLFIYIGLSFARR